MTLYIYTIVTNRQTDGHWTMTPPYGDANAKSIILIHPIYDCIYEVQEIHANWRRVSETGRKQWTMNKTYPLPC